MEQKQSSIRWSPGNQFCFIGDGYAYSVDQHLRPFRIPEQEIMPLLDGSKRHGNPVVDNLITLDINQRDSGKAKNAIKSNKGG